MNDPRFEFDGNLLTQAPTTDGTLDWANTPAVADHSAVITDATRAANGTCTGSSTNPANFTLGGPGTVGQGLLVCDGTISKQTPNDANAFTQGQHEDEGENPIRSSSLCGRIRDRVDETSSYVRTWPPARIAPWVYKGHSSGRTNAITPA